MRVIWPRDRVTVREVYAELLQKKQVAYTTVMTLMGILANKGHLQRHKVGRAFVYEPTQAKGSVISNMVSEFVDRVFGGAAGPLVVSLLEEQKLTPEELAQIARQIEEAE